MYVEIPIKPVAIFPSFRVGWMSFCVVVCIWSVLLLELQLLFVKRPYTHWRNIVPCMRPHMLPLVTMYGIKAVTNTQRTLRVRVGGVLHWPILWRLRLQNATNSCATAKPVHGVRWLGMRLIAHF